MRKRKTGLRIGKLLILLFVTIMLLIFSFPIFWSFLMSFKERGDIFTLTPPFSLPCGVWRNTKMYSAWAVRPVSF